MGLWTNFKCIILSFSLTILTNAAVIYVDSFATGSLTGTSWEDAYTDLQQALSTAVSGDDIWIAAGTYKPTTGIDRTISFVMKDNVDIYGGFNGTEATLDERDWEANETILSGDIGIINDKTDNSETIIIAANANIDGLIVSDAVGGNSGGGIISQYTNPVISNCVIRNNETPSVGGGIYAFQSSPQLNNCLFLNNSAQSSGGAIYLDTDSETAVCPPLSVTNCTFTQNHAYNGGAVCIFGPSGFTSLSFSNNVFTYNTSFYHGGALYIAGYDGNSVFSNCLFYKNKTYYSDGDGGALYSYTKLDLVNCIFWRNTAKGKGSEIYLYDYCNIKNSCVEGGVDGWKVDALNSGYIQDGGGNIADNPLLRFDDKGGVFLKAGSPCIDAGDNSAVTSTVDVNGFPRFYDDPSVVDTGIGTAPIVDMGASEYGPLPNQPTIVFVSDETGDDVNDGLSWTTPFKTLTKALDVALPGDEIWVAAGTYKPTTGSDRAVSFVMKDGVDIYGGFSGTESELHERDWEANETILSGDIGVVGDKSDNSYRVVSGANGRLDGFTIREANNDQAIFNFPICQGGGMFNNKTSPTVSNCSFIDNTAVFGGAVGIYAIDNSGCSPKFRNCRFVGNSAVSAAAPEGGAVHVSVSNNAFSKASFFNCLFYNNSADNGSAGQGGAIFLTSSGGADSPVSIVNCTIVENQTWDSDSGAVQSYNQAFKNLFIRNTIFSNNSNEDIYAPFAKISYCRVGTMDHVIDGGNNISGDPKFLNPAAGDFRLRFGSPCIDAGDNSSVPAFTYYDLNGYQRFVDNPQTNDTGAGYPTVDIGATEYGPEPTSETNWFVDVRVLRATDQLDYGQGLSWDKPFRTIQFALDNATAGDSIYVATGVYTSSTAIQLKDNVAVYGGFQNGQYAIDERNLKKNPSVFEGTKVTGANSLLDGFVFYSSNMLNINVSPIVENCCFYNYSTDSGFSAAVYNNMYNTYPLTIQFINCIFANNQSLNDSSNNGGGAVFNDTYYPDNSVEFVNCTFINNYSATNGGAIYSTDKCNVNIENCVFYGNTAENLGDQIQVGYHLRFVNVTTIKSSNIQGSGGSENWDESLGVDGGGNIDSPPMIELDSLVAVNRGLRYSSRYGSVAFPTYKLKSASPCIDSGNNDPELPESDVYGSPRFVDTVDMGAIEYSERPFYEIPVYYVDCSDGDDSNDGLSWQAAFATIQKALDTAEPGSQIRVAAGTYKPTADTDRTISFVLKDGVDVYGGFEVGQLQLDERDCEAHETILSGDIGVEGDNSDNSNTVVIAANAILDGFTISDGNGGSDYGRGAGIFIEDKYSIIRNCRIRDNESTNQGGGIFSFNASPQLYDCLFYKNVSNQGGALAVEDNSNSSMGSIPITVNNCRFLQNFSERGGGAVFLETGRQEIIRFTNCLFRYNYAKNEGGAISIWGSGGNKYISNCIFTDNVAVNSDYGGGGAIFSYESFHLKNSTLWNNKAEENGSEVYLWGGATEFKNNCIQGGLNGGGIYTDDPTDIVDGGGNIANNPLLRFDDKGGVFLKAGSPCIDAGDNSAVTSPVDVNGYPRLYDDPSVVDTGIGTAPIVDIGASEFGPDPNPVTVLFVSDETGDDANDGLSWATPFKTLSKALDVVASGDEIWLAAGTYKPTTGSDRTVSFIMKDGVDIYGGFKVGQLLFAERDWEANETTLSGDIGAVGDRSDNSYRVVIGANGRLDGFTIRDANNDRQSSDFLISQGGGMFNHNTSPVVVNCRFTDNTATFGGAAGIYATDGNSCSPEFKNCRFTGNSAISSTVPEGGAVHVFVESSGFSEASFFNSLFHQNSADNDSAGKGGAIFLTSSGGTDSPISIVNCTIVENQTWGSDSGAVQTADSAFNNLFLRNTVFYDNSSDDVYAPGVTLSYCLLETMDHVIDGGNNISGDPKFLNPDAGDFRLRSGSPCIDAGDTSAVPALSFYDLNGSERLYDIPEVADTGTGYPPVDMGATEYGPETSGTIWFVDVCHQYADDGLDNGYGRSWSKPFLSVQFALETASPGDSIFVATGIYRKRSSFENDYIQMKDGVNVYGGLEPGQYVLNERNLKKNAVVLDSLNASGANAILDGFTFYSCGLGNYNVSPIVRNCYFRQQHVQESYYGGGAVYNEVVSENLERPIQFINCLFEGIEAYSSYSRFLGGGAVLNNCPSHDLSPEIDFINCTFINNKTGGKGGAIYSTREWTVNITNSVFRGNSAEEDGDQIYFDKQRHYQENKTFIRNSNIQGSGGSENSANWDMTFGIDRGGNIDAQDVYELDSVGMIINEDIDFHLWGMFNFFTYKFRSSSPCINAGTDEDLSLPAFDIYGNPRQNGTVDMGAIEYLSTPFHNFTVYYVDGRYGDDENDGLAWGWGNAFRTIHKALETAVSGDQIWVKEGTFYTTDGTDQSAVLTMKDGVDVYGGFNGTETSLDQRDWEFNKTTLDGDIGQAGNREDNTLTLVETANSVFDGFHLKNAIGSACEGYGNEPIIRNCVFTNNSADSQNKYDRDSKGGALYLEHSYAKIHNCSFLNNKATYDGGAVYAIDLDNANKSLEFDRCRFVQNTVLDGGNLGGGAVAVKHSRSQVKFSNCEFIANTYLNAYSYESGGGAVAARVESIMVFNNCSFYKNSVHGTDARGGAVCSYRSRRDVLFNNCIFWNNTAAEGGEVYTQETSLIFNNCCVEGGFNGSKVYSDSSIQDGGGNIDADPQFMFGGGSTLYLKETSPCIDAGNNFSVDAFSFADVHGNGRFVDNPNVVDTGTGSAPLVDIGASEFQYETFSTPTVHYVNGTSGDDTNDGLSWATAYKTIQKAIDSALPGEQVWVAEGTYKPTNGTDRSISFEMKNSVDVYGGFAGTESSVEERDIKVHETILSGDIGVVGEKDDNSNHVVIAASSLLDGFTVCNGLTGILVKELESGIIRNCIICDNSGFSTYSYPYCGSGIALFSSSASVEGSIIKNNNYMGIWSSLSYDSYQDAATLYVNNCLIINNHDGGVWFEDRIRIIDYPSPSEVVIENSVFSGNKGIGFYAYRDVSFSINSCSLFSNTSEAINCNYIDYPSTVSNCIFWNNGRIYSNFKITYTNCNIEGGIGGSKWSGKYIDGGGNIDADPQFLNAELGILALADTSPCIDAGDNFSVPFGVFSDLNGDSRFYDVASVADTGSGVAPIVDMGAYESQAGSGTILAYDSFYECVEERTMSGTLTARGSGLTWSIVSGAKSGAASPKLLKLKVDGFSLGGTLCAV